MSDIKNKAEKTFRGYLKNFEPDQEALEKGHWDKELPVKLEPDKSPLPALVFICLVILSGFKYWGKSEKTLWEIPIKYKSFPFLLSHRKFGFRLYRKQGVDYPPNIAEEMIQKLNDAIKASEALIQPFAEQQIQIGNVSVANHYIKLDMMYWFFRDKAKRVFSHPAPKLKVFKRGKDGKAVAWGHDPDKYERQGFYYALAMIDAFFSRLEHLLIIALPFIGFDPEKESLSAMMSANWTDKYKRVFDLAIDRKAKSLFDELIFVKERYRNAIMHGYYEKQGASLFFHLPPYAVPVLLSRFKDSIHYSFLPISEKSFEDVCSLFDRIDAFLKSGTTKYGVRYAESGLDVPFDNISMSKYLSASISEKAFEEFVNHIGYLADQSVNMDW